MTISLSLRCAALATVLFAGCAQSDQPGAKSSATNPDCSLTTPSPTPTPLPTETPVEIIGEAIAAPVVEFCCTGTNCGPMSEILAEIETTDLCQSGEEIESGATPLTADDIVASGREVRVVGQQVDAIYGGCQPETDPGTNPTCGDGTLVLELDATDRYVIAFALDGTPTVYRRPTNATSVSLPGRGVKSFGFLIAEGDPWVNMNTSVEFADEELHLDLQTDWAILATEDSTTCRGTKC